MEATLDLIAQHPRAAAFLAAVVVGWVLKQGRPHRRRSRTRRRRPVRRAVVFNPTSRRVPGWMRRYVYKRERAHCFHCGKPVHFKTCERNGCDDCFRADHYVPHVLGGPTTLNNVVCACRWCNLDKGDLMPDVWYRKCGVAS